MSNPNPNLANLTNAGKGRPKLDRVKLTITLSKETRLLIGNYAEQRKISLSVAIEEFLTTALMEN